MIELIILVLAVFVIIACLIGATICAVIGIVYARKAVKQYDAIGNPYRRR